ncbi:MAG: HupE/UreJ family protein [Pseudomonadota bacterium]
MSRAVPILLMLFTIAAAGSPRAHELMPAVLTIDDLGAGQYKVTFRAPPPSAIGTTLTPRFPQLCRAQAQQRAVRGSLLEETLALSCGAPLSGKVVTIEGLSRTATDVLVRVTAGGQTVQTVRVIRDAPQFVVRGETTRDRVLATYGRMGMEHILLGLDHVLFVLALLLLIKSRRALVAAITA